MKKNKHTPTMDIFYKKCLSSKKETAFYYLGWKDSNLRVAVPKTAALPLGDTPTGDLSF